jgi:dTDP-4-dehydrorhamnose reductase
VGSTLVPVLAACGHNVVTAGRAAPAHVSVDLTDANATQRALDAVSPDVIVNLVAVTNVDECERDPRLAYAVNTGTVANVVSWVELRQRACHLVQISTDQVYDGNGPHAEAVVCPINYYAYSKYAAELLAARVHSTILRTNLFGRSRCSGRTSFSDWLVGAIRRDESIKVFEDVQFSPLSLETLSNFIALAVERRVTGTFNLGSREGMSKADFAFALVHGLGLPTRCMTRTVSSAGALLARRPTDMRLDNAAFESRFEVVLPTLQREIALMRDLYV